MHAMVASPKKTHDFVTLKPPSKTLSKHSTSRFASWISVYKKQTKDMHLEVNELVLRAESSNIRKMLDQAPTVVVAESFAVTWGGLY